MSKLKITAPGLYSMVFGLLLALTIGCADKRTVAPTCGSLTEEKKCNESKLSGGTECKWDKDTQKCTGDKTNVLLQEEATHCQTLEPAACKASRECTFDAGKNACEVAAVKNACVNIQDKDVCEKDTTCGGWDGKICKDKTPANQQPNPPVKQPVTEKKSVKVFSVKQVLPAHINSPRVDKVVVNGNKDFAYFVSNDNQRLTTFNMETADKVATNMKATNKWNTKANLETGLADDAVGKAKLTGSNRILSIQPTKKGAVIGMRGGADGHLGAAYMEGADFKAGWRNDPDVGRDIHPMANADVPFHGLVLAKATGEQYMAMFNLADFGGVTNNVDLNADPSEPKALLNVELFRGQDRFASIPLSAPGYLVDTDGISVLPDALGKVVPIEGGRHILPFAKIKVETPDLRSDLWQMVETKENNSVTSVVVANGLLYIGLGSNGKGYRGGVAVYNPAAELTKKTTKPHGSWHHVNVVGLTVDKDNNVWAVTPNAVIKVKSDTTQDTKFDKALVDAQQFTDEFDTETDNTQRFFGMVPSFDQVSSAEWVGDHLIITTLNEGAYFFTHDVKSLIKTTK